MMIAQEQLEFVRRLFARFANPSNVAAPIEIAQGQYISIITLLRSIGHVFEKIDCDSPERKAWAKVAWTRWKNEQIFSDFIEPTRNQLLKEFRGNLELKDDVFGHIAVTVDPISPTFVGKYGWLNTDKIFDSKGEKVMPQIEQALDFWSRNLNEADLAFRKLAS